MPQAMTTLGMLIITTLIARSVCSRSISWMNGRFMGRRVLDSGTRR